MAFVLKLKLKDEHFRVSLEEGQFNYEGVCKAILTVTGVDHGPVMARYWDDEGDLCTLCEKTFSDFVTIAGTEARGRHLFKLEVSIEEPREFVTDPLKFKPQEPCSSSVSCERRRSQNEHNKAHHETWYLHPRKFIWLLSRLRGTGALTSKTVASLVVHSLPQIVSDFSLYKCIVDEMFKKHSKTLLPSVAALREHLEDDDKLLPCQLGLAGLFKEDASASQVIVEVLGKLLGLPLQVQVDFVQRVFAVFIAQIDHALDVVDTKTPDVFKPLVEHPNVACDACDCFPIRGPRFKCKTREDYDLCGECFATQAPLQPEHRFECLAVDWSTRDMRTVIAARHGMRKMGQPVPPPSAEGVSRPCASGCGFAATWHPTHCCARCSMSPGRHGPRCHRLRVQQQQAPPEPPEPSAPPAEDLVPPSALARLCFPVVVEDGRRLEISWAAGADPSEVAADFAQAHGIPGAELAKIQAFVAEAERRALGARAAEQERGLERALQKLAELGIGSVDAEVIRSMLKDADGDLVKVVSLLTCG